MIGTKSPQDWMNDWQQLQSQYWNAWSDATRGSIQPPPASTPWQEGIEQWSKMFGGSSKQSDMAERLMSSAKNYVAVMQSMLSAAAGKMPQGFAVPNWSDALRNGFNMPGMDAAFQNNPFAKIFGEMKGPNLQNLGNLSQSFAPFLNQMKQEGLSWLHAPAFGFAREHQEQSQKMALALVEFQDAIGKYNGLMLKSSQRSFEIFESKIGQHEEPGRQIDSMRALYDLWIDAAEEAYAEIALSDEFRKVYGDVVNSQMRVRQHIQQQVEKMGSDLGMPTRSELNGVHKKLHELRRELRNGRSADASKEIDELREEVRELKRAMTVRKTATVRVKRASPRPRVVTAAAAARVARPSHRVEQVVAPTKKKSVPKSKDRHHRSSAEKAKIPSASIHAPLSFNDAINAMRRSVAKKTAKRKSAAARASVAVKSSKIVERKRRTKTRRG
ncbi:MAG: class III poly(R)-hydroxyalkanoic acid synthase subunit PhaE [Rudaea sp.]